MELAISSIDPLDWASLALQLPLVAIVIGVVFYLVRRHESAENDARAAYHADLQRVREAHRQSLCKRDDWMRDIGERSVQAMTQMQASTDHLSRTVETTSAELTRAVDDLRRNLERRQ